MNEIIYLHGKRIRWKDSKIIGHTESGKYIYDVFAHPSYKLFTEWDHNQMITQVVNYKR